MRQMLQEEPRMKLRAILVSLLLGVFVISACAFAAETKPAPEPQAPTLDETIKWLSDKLSASGGYSCTGTRIDYKCLERGKGTAVILSLGEYHTYTIPLSDLKAPEVSGPKGTKDCPKDRIYTLLLSTKNGQKSIRASSAIMRYSDGAWRDSGERSIEQTSDQSIFFTDKDTAERVRKAFDHAIKLARSEELF